MEIEKKPTVEIIKEMTLIDQQINILIVQYNKLQKEITKRFPTLESKNEFKPKVKRK